jgi:hypothetical protein
MYLVYGLLAVSVSLAPYLCKMCGCKPKLLLRDYGTGVETLTYGDEVREVKKITWL